MSRPVKLALGVFAAILISLVGLATYLILAIDPSQYLPQISAAVEERTGRRLKIDRVALSLFPRIELIAYNVAFSERIPNVEFAAAEKVSVALKWLPLLQRRLVFGGITVQGVRARVERYRDGTTNLDDLWTLGDDSGGGVDIDYLKIENGTLVYAADGNVRSTATNIQLQTGRIAPPVPTHVDGAFSVRDEIFSSDIKVTIKMVATLDATERRYTLSAIELGADGQSGSASGIMLRASGAVAVDRENEAVTVSPLGLELKHGIGGGALTVRVETAALGFTAAGIDARPIAIEASYARGADRGSASLAVDDVKGSAQSLQISAVTGRMAGQHDRTSWEMDLDSALTVNLRDMTVAITKLTSRAEVTDSRLKKNALTGTLGARGTIDFGRQDARFNFDAKVDRSAMRGDLTITGYAAPSYEVNATIDEIDLGAYLRDAIAPQNSTGSSFQLSSLVESNVRGRIDIGSLIWSDMRARNVRIEMR